MRTFHRPFFHLLPILIAVPLLLATPTSPAVASTLTVARNDPGGCSDSVVGKPFCTIGAAVNRAGPGDTIEVKKDTYKEKVLITVSDLHLKGDRVAIIDGGGSGTVIELAGVDRVSVENFKIRNGEVGIELYDVQDAVIEDNEVVQCVDTGISVDAQSLRNVLKGNEVKKCSVGFNVRGNENKVEHNEARDNERNGFTVLNSSPLPTGNTLIRNKSKKNGGHGYELLGQGHTLERNEAKGNAEQGFEVFGCSNAPCKDILKNNVAESNRAIGFHVDASGNMFQGNMAKDNVEDGFNVDGEGDDNTFQGNLAKRNGGDGFDVGSLEGDDNTFQGNLAEKNGGDGFNVDSEGDDNTFQGNLAKKNQQFGFRNGDPGSDNIFTDNTCKKNTLGGSNPRDSGLCTPQP